MPWCEACSRYWAPTAMNDDGTCPSCGRPVERATVRTREPDEDEHAPWHFKLMVVALIAYLGWRVVDVFV